MHKKTKILVFMLVLVMIGITAFLVLSKSLIVEERTTKLKDVEGLTVVPTMRDEISTDSSWCGTFQLVWNDMKNNVVKTDVVFSPQEEMASNLNREEFNENMISEEYYYKTYGVKNIELKERIEKGIKEKFNQTSDILEEIDWSDKGLDDSEDPTTKRYLFYSMLYRKFEFLNEFDKLEKGKFGKKHKDIEYFGIGKNTKDIAGKQIEVLYYNSKKDFAVIINTKTNDEVIFCKKPRGKTFKEIYENMNGLANKYNGNKKFKTMDELKVPNLTFNEKREYEELTNKKFKTADLYYKTGVILQAIQSIKFALDEKGGEIKSEAIIDMMVIGSSADKKPKAEKPRYFYVDDTFVIFLREKGQSMPYFASRVENINKFQ